MTREIPLTQGKVARVSSADYEFLRQWKWQATKSTHGGWYAVRTERPPSGKKLNIYMHNEIMKPPPGMEVDHRDNDGLNNTRENLRNCTHNQNMWNRKNRIDNKSGFKGVYWLERDGKWMAKLMKNGKSILQKGFDSREDAARAYDKAAREHFGEFAVLNFPDK